MFWVCFYHKQHYHTRAVFQQQSKTVSDRNVMARADVTSFLVRDACCFYMGGLPSNNDKKLPCEDLFQLDCPCCLILTDVKSMTKNVIAS